MGLDSGIFACRPSTSLRTALSKQSASKGRKAEQKTGMTDAKKAVVLLSGGIDSAATLFIAKERGYKCYPLLFDYGQRHKKELISARRIAAAARSDCTTLKIALSIMTYVVSGQ